MRHLATLTLSLLLAACATSGANYRYQYPPILPTLEHSEAETLALAAGLNNVLNLRDYPYGVRDRRVQVCIDINLGNEFAVNPDAALISSLRTDVPVVPHSDCAPRLWQEHVLVDGRGRPLYAQPPASHRDPYHLTVRQPNFFLPDSVKYDLTLVNDGTGERYECTALPDRTGWRAACDYVERWIF